MSNEFREVGRSDLQGGEGNCLFFFFPFIFLGIIYSRELGLSSRVILIRLLVFRVIAFYGPCLEIVCKLAVIKILIALEDYRLWSSYRSPAFYFYFFHQ